MTYRRDVQVNDEAISLPVEMVYNSYTDAITNVDKETGDKSYFRNGNEHFNRIYFKYPPEWKTSNVGEKIIGVRNMRISIRKHLQLEFTLYIRKYRQDKFKELAKGLYNEDELDDLNDEQIQDIINRMNKEDINVYVIEYASDIFDNIDDFIKEVNYNIDRENIYLKLYKDIIESNKTNAEKIVAIEQLDKDKDSYSLMCLRNNIPFYLTNNEEIKDTNISVEIGDKIMLTFGSVQNEYNEFYVDFMMTPLNNNETYKKFYMWDDNTDEPLPYAAVRPEELDESDRFEFDTAWFFNIGTTNPNRNNIEHVTKFHRELTFYNVMTNLQCEVAASFANQSNHNLIGRTNETFNPIKYYKLNDNEDKFWVEFYDRNEIEIPVAFNDFVMFTMDVVFLQNRKLLYS